MNYVIYRNIYFTETLLCSLMRDLDISLLSDGNFEKYFDSEGKSKSALFFAESVRSVFFHIFFNNEENAENRFRNCQSRVYLLMSSSNTVPYLLLHISC